MMSCTSGAALRPFFTPSAVGDVPLVPDTGTNKPELPPPPPAVVVVVVGTTKQKTRNGLVIMPKP